MSDFLEEYITARLVNPGRTLIAGSKLYETSVDRRYLYPDKMGIDISDGEGVDLVHDLECPLPETVGFFKHAHCCSLLEHVKNPWAVAANIQAALETNGTIVLTAPFVWRVHGYPSDYWRFTKDAIRHLFPGIEWESLDYVAHDGFVDRAPSRNKNDVCWFQRTEVYGFGAKL